MNKSKHKKIWLALVLFVLLLSLTAEVFATPIALPKIGLEVDSAEEPQDVVLSLQILGILTVLTLLRRF